MNVCLLLTVLLFIVSPAEAQQPTKVPRIGYLSGTDPATDSPRAEGIRAALRELGYIEGQNVIIEYRHAEGKRDRYPELLADLVRLKVELIVVAGGTTPIQAAKNATKTISIVMAGTGLDPVKAGFVECCTKVIMSGVNDKVIMSGCGDDNPDDERREAARGNTKSV
jgi:putative tryptophan/tyrosine transport system substrate-binding protein